MKISKKEIEHLLYEGNVIGLDEVQLLEPVPTYRIHKVRTLLKKSDLYLTYQASLVLTAWGDPCGFNKICDFIIQKIHREIVFEPLRRYGYDNIYDIFAEAIEIYGYTQKNHQSIIEAYRKLLELYGECIFESRLKIALLNKQYDALSHDIV
jgi:hypothetical protein